MTEMYPKRTEIYSVYSNTSSLENVIGTTFDLKEAKNYLKEYPDKPLRIEKRKIIIQTSQERFFVDKTGVFK